ncbi:hypothetical protein MPTK1_1g13690 [Marchantia polymorpha subsp. ruderalis]|uniref:Uncharacterized protein n=2 Tax=Marchantia polymorpha TaxID=3197 RepID=A0AAF6APT6_MARPO|nr:hypothetical protein MARPO_0019s0139 [Marchantia polymorpha]BBM98456.1 hypothetical protein Mp_1g13690 [Marchantia polymorpha subsp. ruderalis]|eukprot:PTQ44727.1 hypothetical protein MARPO_0019s0139 [Marchantia polymorpha]
MTRSLKFIVYMKIHYVQSLDDSVTIRMTCAHRLHIPCTEREMRRGAELFLHPKVQNWCRNIQLKRAARLRSRHDWPKNPRDQPWIQAIETRRGQHPSSLGKLVGGSRRWPHRVARPRAPDQRSPDRLLEFLPCMLHEASGDGGGSAAVVTDNISVSVAGAARSAVPAVPGPEESRTSRREFSEHGEVSRQAQR